MRTLAMFALILLPTLAWCADETDPEPPGGDSAELRKLKGTWTVIRALTNGKEIKGPANWTYTFDKGKVVIDRAGRQQTMKVKLNTKKKPFTIELTLEGAKTSQAALYKIEKGELFLGGGKATTTLDGQNGLVFVMSKQVK